MWPRTDLLDLLGITHPIIQAPMSGFTSPALVAAVSNAGALGSLGCSLLPTGTMREQIEEHLAANISIATLAGLARLSTHHFCRAFKQSFGIPPHRYHMVRRIERAKILLLEQARSVTEIGLDLGFSETSSFSSLFRRLTGQTPSAFRREAPYDETRN